MKICPACQNQYTDDTLQFCLQDGTPLTFARQADTPTAVLGETETHAALGGDKFQVPIHQPTSTPPVSHVTAVPQGKKSNTAMAVLLTVVGMLILFGVAGVAAWFYLRKPEAKVVSNVGNNAVTPVVALNNNLDATPKQVRPSPTPLATSNANTATPRVDDSHVQSDVISAINGWKSQAEALDLDSYMEHYAPVVEYYNKKDAALSYVRADKMRAFSRYDSIRVNLSNISVTIEQDGTAVAVFDKEWDFEGDQRSRGKVRQMMRLRNINGRWLITAEKDIKLIYKQ